jgi:hypothetical protein
MAAVDPGLEQVVPPDQIQPGDHLAHLQGVAQLEGDRDRNLWPARDLIGLRSGHERFQDFPTRRREDEVARQAVVVLRHQDQVVVVGRDQDAAALLAQVVQGSELIRRIGADLQASPEIAGMRCRRLRQVIDRDDGNSGPRQRADDGQAARMVHTQDDGARARRFALTAKPNLGHRRLPVCPADRATKSCGPRRVKLGSGAPRWPCP